MVDTSTRYTAREKLADGCIHAIGIIASIMGAAFLMAIAAGALPASSILSIVVYATTLVAVFVISAGYHMIAWPPMKSVLRRLDHAAIYLKIAGTYTPLALIKMAGLPGHALLAGVWAVTLFGATAKLFWPEHLVRTSYVLYLAAGWAGLFTFEQLMASLSLHVIILLAVGGILYTVGVVFHLWRSLPYHNAVWHGFVLVASSCHYAAIMCAIAPELSS